MRIAGRGVIFGGVLVALAGCGGGGRHATAWVPDTSEAVRLLRSPDNPYRIVYHEAVDLTKRPDTTKAAPPHPIAPAAPKKTRG